LPNSRNLRNLRMILAAGTLIPVLERTKPRTDGGGVVREWAAPYDQRGEREWWEEMVGME
jgi:hypothetical protein